MKEVWSQCQKTKVPKDNYELDKMVCDGSNAKIFLIGDMNSLLVEFNGGVWSAKFSDEIVRIKTYNKIGNLPEFSGGFCWNPLYKIENSELLDWAMEESEGYGLDLQHYVLVTQDSIADILSLFPPAITVRRLEEEGYSEVRTIESEGHNPFPDLS